MSTFALTKSDLFENPTARLPVVLCLDASGSMSGEPISELTQGVLQFMDDIASDELACHSVELAIITFGGTVSVKSNFGQVGSHEAFDIFPNGGTPMGAAVQKALDLLEHRKNCYKETGVDYYQPWLVLMTDGMAGDSVTKAANTTRALEESRRLSIFPIGIGEQADLNCLQKFSQRPPLRLKGLEFRKFFRWLSASVQQVSVSMPGDNVQLDQKGIKGWACV